VPAFVCAGAGFLLAVLWFDLMFDVQARHEPVPVDAVRSISAYYRRVTTDAAPRNLLVAAAMAWTVVALVVEIAVGPRGAGIAALGPALVAVGLATLHTVPTAVRIGAAPDPADPALGPATRSVLRDHRVCFVLIAAVIAVQLLAAL
jgi:hypothetical protein